MNDSMLDFCYIPSETRIYTQGAQRYFVPEKAVAMLRVLAKLPI